LGLAVNFSLGAAKLFAGLVGNSFALLSDAVNSLGDSLTSIVVLYALRVAQRPADAEHPYGHTRAEAIAASNVALVIILSGLVVGWESLQRLGTIHPAPPVWTLWIAAANAVIKEGLYRYKVRVGRRIGSVAIIANAWDHRSDALCSLAVLAGLSLVRWGGPALADADEAAALFVVVAILTAGIRLFCSASSELMDPQADPEFVAQIRGVATAVPGVYAVEKLWVRKTGLEYLADIHIEVDGQMAVEEGHRIGHDVKDRLLDGFPALRDVLVHLEPAQRHAVPSGPEARQRV
jgi:cation diffusion facilitator family transporter